MLIERKRIPDKIYYSISEVSKYTGVEPHVLRYWETKFSKLKPKRVGGNQRKYTKSDLELLFVIIDLLYNEGYTLDGAEKKLKEGYGRKNAKATPATVETVLSDEPDESPALRGRKGAAEAGVDPKLLKDIKKELQYILKLLG